MLQLRASLPIEITKKELAISVKKGGTDRLPTSPNVSRLKKKSVLLGWMNYDNLKNKYIGVRASRGSGIRTVHFRNEIEASVILVGAETSCGKNNFGNIDKFIVNLGNYKGELVTGNELENFTLSEYIRTNKLSKTRLYMLKRKKSPNRIILDQANSFIYASDYEIDSLDFSHSSYHHDFETSPQAQNVPLLRNDQAMMNPTINSQLLGTNEERHTEK